MSHAVGKIDVDGKTVGWFEYNGTSDLCLRAIRESPEEVWTHWRKNDGPDVCRCPGTPAVIVTSYGGGFEWDGRVCLEHRQICRDSLFPHMTRDVDWTDSVESTAKK